MSDLHCKNCGHASGYHSTPVCGISFGASRSDRCQCSKFESLELARMRDQLAEARTERDAYMQTVLDLIHDLARHGEGIDPAEQDK